MAARLLHVSDTHLAAPGAQTEYPDIDPVARLSAVLGEAAAYGPFDAVVMTGDVCEDGSVEGAQAAQALARGLAPVTLAVPGNHDRSESVAQVFGEPTARIGGWHVVGVDTHQPGLVGGRAEPWLAALEGLDDTPTVLLGHHPVASRSDHEWFVLAGPLDELRGRIEGHRGPLALLSGHTHQAYAARLGSARLLGAPATFYAIEHAPLDWRRVPTGTGARVVDLGKDGAIVTNLVWA